MDNEVPIANFSSENLEVGYFKYFPVSKWNFGFFKKYMGEKRRKPKLAIIFTKYKHCLNILMRFTDLPEDKKLIVNDFIEKCDTSLQQQQPQQQPLQEINFYNHRTVGVQAPGRKSKLEVKLMEKVKSSTESSNLKKFSVDFGSITYYVKSSTEPANKKQPKRH
ncbi:hypothetical protein K501DRAFT_278034 [Backusella circina FSU 941]|nr:hypothetical protein K501DRAFT_278034 [Backusella circina FSU 941]